MHTKRINSDDLIGSFSDLLNDAKDIVMEIVANFHYRNAEQHDDGSRGKIVITPGELNNALAYAMRHFGG